MEWGQAIQDECLNPKSPQGVVGSQGKLKGECTSGVGGGAPPPAPVSTVILLGT